MNTIVIPRAEHGTIRVFAISRPIANMARALKQQSKIALASELLGHDVVEGDIEIFALSDLAGIGLHGYLSEGYGVDKQALHLDRTRLDALDGYVLLLFSTLSDTGDVSITPARDLTLIGTYAEPAAKHVAPPIQAEAAKPYTGASKPAQEPRRSRVGSVFTAVAALLALFILWWILR